MFNAEKGLLRDAQSSLDLPVTAFRQAEPSAPAGDGPGPPPPSTRAIRPLPAQMLQGVTAVAGKVSRSTRPFTGATPAELKSRVDGVDLDSPLADTAAALEELEDVYLRDAVYFHDPKYAAHLNCPS